MTINKIALISDLHLDFWAHAYRNTSPAPEMGDLLNIVLQKCVAAKPDAIVIAGDMSNGSYVPEHMMSMLSDIQLIWVKGNHDFYGHPLEKEPEFAITDQLFAATLWTEFNGAMGLENQIYKQIADSAHILETSALKVQLLFYQTWEMIKNAKREIVVTHFPPSNLSSDDRYAGNFTNPYFTNNLDFRIEGSLPSTKLWICGHVHHKHSYSLGSCLVVCNPLGYPGEEYKSIVDYEPVILEKIGEEWRILS